MMFALLSRISTENLFIVLEEIISSLDPNIIMENWNQDHLERYSNFYDLYIKF